MTKKIITMAFMFFSIVSFAQSKAKQGVTTQPILVAEKAIYQLFPTKNYWTFIKLDTRNGKMWQVYFSLEDENKTSELVINSLPLVTEQNEINGRFTLYPTENMYNFLLLDQINGIVAQVQWSHEAKSRGIVSFITSID